MNKLIIILSIVSFSLSGSCQSKGEDITGIWQYKTNVLSSGYLDNYVFNNIENAFEFKTNEYNGLNRIISIGGKYEILKDTLVFNIEYMLEYIGGYPIRSRTTTLSDSWELIEGEIKKVDLKDKEIIEKASFSYEVEKENEIEYLLIDDRKYYKVSKD